MKININSNLLPMKGHYFFFNGGVSPVQPFMPVIAKDLKFSSSAVGVINGILPFAGMFAKPVFGAIADRFRLHKLTFICFQILTIIGFFNIQFIPEIKEETGGKVKLVCGAETNFDVTLKETNKKLECYLKKVLSDNDRTVKCSMRCDLSPELRTELCGPWKANPSICSENISSKTTVAEYEHVIKDEKEFSNEYQEKFSSLDSAKLEFIATVPLRHTLRVADKLYFRVEDAELNDETHHIPYCKNETHTYCNIQCSDSVMSAILAQTTEEQHDSSFVNYYQFWVFLFLAILSWIGMAVVGSVADAVCFEMLGEKASQYGRQRLFGSIGWGIFAIISGLMVDYFSKNGKTNYTSSFYLMLILIALDVFVSYNLKYEQTKISPNLLVNVGKLLSNVWIDIFLVWCIIVGMCVGIQWTYLFWHLDDLFNSCDDEDSNKKTLFGLVSGVQCFLGEIPFFFVYGSIVKKIGHVHLMTLIPFLIGIRFILYSLLSDPWLTLPIEILQGSVGLTFATLASYASVVAPPGAEATTQGLVGAIFEGIGVSLGSYVGGVIISHYNGTVLFQIFALVAFGLSVLHGAAHFFLGKTSKIQSNEFNGIAKYATPNEAVSMLEDT